MNDLVVIDEFEKVADQESSRTFLKFAKGEWTERENVMNGERLIVQVDRAALGWRKWVDGKIVDTDIGYVVEGFHPKPRADLGDLDESTWPDDADGSRTDPWQYGLYLPFVSNDGETYTWPAISRGAKRAVATLLRSYALRRKRGLFGLPVVELKTTFYRHKQYGKVDVPVLTIVGWTDERDQPPGDGRPFDDGLPEIRG